MNCEKCLKKCKAECCGVVPIPKKVFNKFSFARKPSELKEIGSNIFAYDKDNYCAYLNDEFKCSIYDHRPEVCRKFGDESHPLLFCPWQNKKGKLRSWLERRKIEKISGNLIKKISG